MRKGIFATTLGLVSVLSSQTVIAMDTGTSSPDDYRIKKVVYNQDDTVRINAVAGIAVHVQVAPDEEYVTHVFGEEGGWTFSHVENNFFFRPAADKSDTNLTIITNKRTYHLLLHYIGYKNSDESEDIKDRFIKTPWSMKSATVGVKYQYPDENRKISQRKLNKKRIRKALANANENEAVNLRYRMSNNKEDRGIQPRNVWDNYNKTYFKFQPGKPLPTIFEIGPEGKETVANVNIGKNGNTLVANGVSKEWRIRYGDKVIGLINDGYNPSINGDNESGTVSNKVKRVSKDKDDFNTGDE